MKKYQMLISFLFLFLSFSSGADTNFILIGDTGQDNEGQWLVSQSLHKFCRDERCEFGILAGDNVYPRGVSSPQDQILSLVFDKYYNTLNFPFLVALGNHDYGSRIPDWERGSYQMLHNLRNPAFHLPSNFYTYSTENVIFAIIDTTKLMWKKDEENQASMLASAYQEANSTGKWLMVVGHHPFLSNGQHGNAGNYDGLSFPSQVSGSSFKRFFQENICGKAHFYLSGHDHSLQAFDGKVVGCNTHLIVSGAGAESTKLTGHNAALFNSLELGYFHLSATAQEVRVRSINEKLKLLFEKIYLKE